jgi:C-terminal processing protease CtpA/Prc
LERREHTRQPDPVKARSGFRFSAFFARRTAHAAALALAISSAGCGGSTGTIGAVLGQRPDGRLFVREAPAHLAAAEHGVRVGDEVLLIDGRDVRAMSVREVHRALEGDIGETVKLTLVRGGDIIRVTLRLTPAVRARAASENPQ